METKNRYFDNIPTPAGQFSCKPIRPFREVNTAEQAIKDCDGLVQKALMPDNGSSRNCSSLCEMSSMAELKGGYQSPA
ncbi:unnamed protein product [Nesidiocoris tenuis]|uniref:Uncharacterized protein n=1 Tax=Nesidiocoris tenuis TaxID=355587 RepID=A0A6H5G6W8_9HEMI|nr:unnamed protein product [Nesidiocoris tenuis]